MGTAEIIDPRSGTRYQNTKVSLPPPPPSESDIGENIDISAKRLLVLELLDL